MPSLIDRKQAEGKFLRQMYIKRITPYGKSYFAHLACINKHPNYLKPYQSLVETFGLKTILTLYPEFWQHYVVALSSDQKDTLAKKVGCSEGTRVDTYTYQGNVSIVLEKIW